MANPKTALIIAEYTINLIQVQAAGFNAIIDASPRVTVSPITLRVPSAPRIKVQLTNITHDIAA
jgi:hypothetical protein